MRTEYAVEIYNKNNKFIEQVDVFNTYEEAETFIKEIDIDIDIDKDSEHFGIIEIEYDDDNEIGVNRM